MVYLINDNFEGVVSFGIFVGFESLHVVVTFILFLENYSLTHINKSNYFYDYILSTYYYDVTK